MVSDMSTCPRLSKLTLAVANDSGWFQADLAMAESHTWGRSTGCPFLRSACPKGNFHEICPEPHGQGCSSDHVFRTECRSSEFSEECALNLPFENCKVPRRSSEPEFAYGRKSMCLERKVRPKLGRALKPGCQRLERQWLLSRRMRRRWALVLGDRESSPARVQSGRGYSEVWQIRGHLPGPQSHLQETDRLPGRVQFPVGGRQWARNSQRELPGERRLRLSFGLQRSILPEICGLPERCIARNVHKSAESQPHRPNESGGSGRTRHAARW